MRDQEFSNDECETIRRGISKVRGAADWLEAAIEPAASPWTSGSHSSCEASRDDARPPTPARRGPPLEFALRGLGPSGFDGGQAGRAPVPAAGRRDPLDARPGRPRCSSPAGCRRCRTLDPDRLAAQGRLALLGRARRLDRIREEAVPPHPRPTDPDDHRARSTLTWPAIPRTNGPSSVPPSSPGSARPWPSLPSRPRPNRPGGPSDAFDLPLAPLPLRHPM
ncbi:DUF6192 family protein [Streptomyces goshikiensis]